MDNFDLPSVNKWVNRLNDCGKPVNPNAKTFCDTQDKTYVWELRGIKIETNYGDWAYMESPFQWRLAVGADGIGFFEYDKDGNPKRCTRYTSFTPWRNADLTNLDPKRENQFVRYEKTLGPRTPIRPNVFDQFGIINVVDETGTGILCFDNKTFIAFFVTYISNTSEETFQFIDNVYTCYYAPREIARSDRIEYMLSRLSGCNARPCVKQTCKEWPCVSGECQFGDVKEGDENSEEEMEWYTDQTGKVIKIQKKRLLNPKPPCFNVCQDTPVCPPPEVVCKTYIDDLAKCSQQLKDATAEIIKLKGQLKGCQTQLSAANAEIARLKKPEVRRNIIAYSSVNYFLELLSNSNFVCHALDWPDYEETWSRLSDALKGGPDLWKREDEVGFGTFQSVYLKIRDSMEATGNIATKNMGYMYATFVKLACIFAMLGTCDFQDITDADNKKLQVWYKAFADGSSLTWKTLFDYLNNNNIGEVTYIKPKLIGDLSFSQAKADKKTEDSGLGSTEPTQEESQEDPVSGVDSDDVFRRPRDPPQGGDDSSISSDKENQPERMEDEDEDNSSTQRQ